MIDKQNLSHQSINITQNHLYDLIKEVISQYKIYNVREFISVKDKINDIRANHSDLNIQFDEISKLKIKTIYY